ncbi:MAG: short-chain fatty acid transporter [Acidobacteria bacterium]|nr:short-chain fatty acid transporter [Acidobacteriota bacterium]
MLQRIAARALAFSQHYMPAPYLLSLLLTFVSAALAFAITHTAVEKILSSWYGGIWEILAFTTQMALILLCGHALVDAPLVRRALDRISAIPRTAVHAGMLVFLVGWATALFNWGFSLVVSGVLVREIPRRMTGVSKGYLAAAGYTGWAVWASGISSSIALVTATPGSPMNIIERMSGATIPLSETLLPLYNVVPVLGMAILMPLLFAKIHPASETVPRASASGPLEHPAPDAPVGHDASGHRIPKTIAERIEQSRLVTIILVGMAALFIVQRIAAGAFNLDLNMMIFLLLALGWALHGTPISYMQAFHGGAKAAGPILLAYPLYGGILGLIRDTGLADWFAQQFVAFSTSHTLPFWSYVSSNVITLFVPSGGGHWAVQGPVMVKAALELDASLAKTAMAVAFGEQTGNLFQPFWALPIVSIGGVSVREMMGYCMVAFFIAFPLFGIALLVF